LPGGAAGAAARTTSTANTSGITTKTITLSYPYQERDGTNKVAESGLLEDIYITSDPRTNRLIVSAPEKTMFLLDKLIFDLDVPPAARAYINVFHMRRADATATATILQQLFLGTGGIGTTRPGGAPGAPGGFPGGTGGLPGGAGTTTGTRPLQFTIGGVTPEGAPLIDVRVTVDERTNNIIAAGSENDLFVIGSLISRLDDSEVQDRRNRVIHLRNATAADLAGPLSTFLTNTLAVYTAQGLLPQNQAIDQQVVIVAEPITNKLLISATPLFFEETLRLIEELDADVPQVVVQSLVAEVDLTGSEEFGVELGLQSPVLFNRGIIPAPGLFGTGGSVSYANAVGGVITPGVTVNTSINPTAQPSFNFNTIAPLPSNPVVGPGTVGFQGLGNLGVGRVSPNSGVGGFVFSAASDSFSLLVRALKTQGRMDILNRTGLTVMDNQTATIVIGQNFPTIGATNITGTGIISNSIVYQKVGIQLSITPRISPDGKVFMRVTPIVSSIAPTTVLVGNGVNAVAINTQEVDTTIIAQDGETVALAGLIQRTDQKAENKIPWFGDLPAVGALFRYRTQMKQKKELMFILTPRIVRTKADADRILCEESARMDWVLGDVLRAHGTVGMEPVVQASKGNCGGGGGGSGVDGCVPLPSVLPQPPIAVPPQTLPPPPGEPVSPPKPGPPIPNQTKAPTAVPAPALAPAPVLAPAPSAPTGVRGGMLPAAPASNVVPIAPLTSMKNTTPGSQSVFRPSSQVFIMPTRPDQLPMPLSSSPAPGQGEPVPTVTPLAVTSSPSPSATIPSAPIEPRKESDPWQNRSR
jgi:type II secretory pathway component GspD/PulD (secretin)